MALKVPIASFSTTLTAKVSTTATTFYLDTTTADDGTDLDGLVLGFVVDKGKSTEEYIIGTVDTATLSLTSVVRGISVVDGSTAGTGQIHRKKAVIEITAFPYLTDAIRVLNGTIASGGVIKNPTSRTISDSRHLTDKEYVDAAAGAAGGITAFLVTDAGGITVDVGSGYFVTDDGVVTYAGATGQALTDNATNYVMLDTDGTLVLNTTGWVSTNTPLAIVTTVGGDITGVTDARGWLTSPSADRIITDDYTYGATIAAGEAVFVDTADGKWKLADGSAESTASGIIGIAIDAGVDTDTGKRVQLAGHVTGLTGLTAGYQYLSDTAGALSASPGTFKKMIGYAPNTTSVVLLPTYGPLQLDGVNSSATLANFNEAMTFFANTDITGAEAETLTDGSNADAKHTHAPNALDESLFATGVVKLPVTLDDTNLVYAANSIGGNATWRLPGSIHFSTGNNAAGWQTVRTDGTDAIAGSGGSDGIFYATTAAQTGDVNLGTSWTAIIRLRLSTLPATTDDFFIGFAEDADTLDASGTFPTTSRHIGLAYYGTGTTWRTSTGDNTTQEAQNVSTPSAGWHELKIVVTTGTNVKFYLDNTLLTTHSTNIPSQGALLFYMAHINNGAVVKQLELSRHIDFYVPTT